MSMSSISSSFTNNILFLENKTENNYILEYKTDKPNFIYLLSGENRIIKTKLSELNCKLSSVNNQVKDFSFFAEIPGNYFLLKSPNTNNSSNLDVLFDIRNGNKINLQPTFAVSKNSYKSQSAEKVNLQELNKKSKLKIINLLNTL